jgi:hypothetical protein
VGSWRNGCSGEMDRPDTTGLPLGCLCVQPVQSAHRASPSALTPGLANLTGVRHVVPPVRPVCFGTSLKPLMLGRMISITGSARLLHSVQAGNTGAVPPPGQTQVPHNRTPRPPRRHQHVWRLTQRRPTTRQHPPAPVSTPERLNDGLATGTKYRTLARAEQPACPRHVGVRRGPQAAGNVPRVSGHPVQGVHALTGWFTPHAAPMST